MAIQNKQDFSICEIKIHGTPPKLSNPMVCYKYCYFKVYFGVDIKY